MTRMDGLIDKGLSTHTTPDQTSSSLLLNDSIGERLRDGTPVNPQLR